MADRRAEPPQKEPPQKTRERILDVSLRLFTEQGYDGTSLREIAEELGVTKAALYYHFKTKEEILESLLATMIGEASALADWAEQQPPGDATRDAILRRAAEIAYGPARRVVQMVQQNQTAMRDLRSQREHQGPPMEMLRRIIAPLTAPDATYEEQVRARLALFSIFASAFQADIDIEVSDDERREVALRIARDVLAASPSPTR